MMTWTLSSCFIMLCRCWRDQCDHWRVAHATKAGLAGFAGLVPRLGPETGRRRAGSRGGKRRGASRRSPCTRAWAPPGPCRATRSRSAEAAADLGAGGGRVHAPGRPSGRPAPGGQVTRLRDGLRNRLCLCVCRRACAYAVRCTGGQAGGQADRDGNVRMCSTSASVTHAPSERAHPVTGAGLGSSSSRTFTPTCLRRGGAWDCGDRLQNISRATPRPKCRLIGGVHRGLLSMAGTVLSDTMSFRNVCKTWRGRIAARTRCPGPAAPPILSRAPHLTRSINASGPRSLPLRPQGVLDCSQRQRHGTLAGKDGSRAADDDRVKPREDGRGRRHTTRSCWSANSKSTASSARHRAVAMRHASTSGGVAWCNTI